MIKHQKLKIYLFIVFQITPVYLEAASTCTEWVAKAVSVQGKVETRQAGNSSWENTQQGDVFCQGDKIRTDKNSRATLQLSNDTLVSVDQNTNLNFSIPKVKASSWILELIEGSTFFRSRESQRLNIHTPFINAVHEGTEFLVSVSSDKTEITVFDGQVAATNQQGKIQIKKGFTGIAKKDQSPRVKVLTIRPEDAVQWALYYPPLIDYQHIKSRSLQSAINAYEQGDIYQALNDLENLPVSQQDMDSLLFKSSLLLSVGRVDEALTLIKQTPSSKQNSMAVALQSIIAVAKNKQKEALNLAQQAVSLNPQSAESQIALSYAFQANFKIEPALQATKEAVRLSPDNALAWARLSELQLSMGEHSEALESAKKAQQLNPKLSRTQTILGFSHLAEIDIDEAKVAFNKAIHLNSADPLARLGLGLAKIRKGNIEEGARDLETAVSLDPDNSIMRSYLGKAYYELKEDGYAGTELAIAKEMDGNDPTPWFYDAIRKQTTNRPVEALHDMQKAIELNDNRGIYRSKLLLDEDLAARSASLGRIYNDLGFERLGLVEGWRSVNSDPSNYSAHKLLSDNYAVLPRHEIARVSELLQSQLLQPINMTPVQPHLAESNLRIFDGLGSQSSSFNEFNPLFARDRIVLQTSGTYGNNNTWGDEVTLSGVLNKFSYSLGQFHYETDGFRDNNYFKTDLYNAFMQYAITPKLNVQVEYRHRESSQGDLVVNFDPTDLMPNDQDNEKRNTVRLGAHYSQSPKSDFIVSLIYAGRDVNFKQSPISPPHTQGQINSVGYQGETQYIFKHDLFNFVLGGGVSTLDSDERVFLDFFGSCPLPTCKSQKNPDAEDHANAYLYTNVKFPSAVTWTVGVSFDSVNSVDLKLNKVNPKLGMQWDIASWIRLRLAYYKTVKRATPVDQTIEPTQISGFNQLFDDSNGTQAERYGVGLDAQLSDQLYAGVEYSHRNLNVPVTFRNEPKISSRSEEIYDTYIHWTPHLNWGVSLEPTYEKFTRSPNAPSIKGRALPKVKTLIVPLKVKYFHSSGFFAHIGGSYIDQKVDLAMDSSFTKNQDDFFIFDAAIGYRFPKQLGIISLNANNITDEDFLFQDLNTQTSGKSVSPRFVPDRTIFIQATFAFD